MPIVKEKAVLINADYFDKSKPQAEWPSGIVANAKSASGYSYKTMNKIIPAMGTGYEKIDGFVMPDKHWLLTDNSGNAWIENDADFQKKYSL